MSLASRFLITLLVTPTVYALFERRKLKKESDVAEMETHRKIRLHIKTADLHGTMNVLSINGFSSAITEDGIIEMSGNDAISDPARVNKLLVNNGYTPSLVKLEEEDLEAFFLRVINN